MAITSAVLLLPLLLAAEPLGPGDHRRSLEVGELTRTYLVHVPKSYDGETPLPVVLAFHGAATNADLMVRFTGLNEKADSAGFIAAYPNGTGVFSRLLTWNGGGCCGYASRNEIDDVAFIRALLDDLESRFKVDAKRIFATGLSNGGIFSYRLASELSDRIAAIAPVGGVMALEQCRPSRPVSVVHFHGTEDTFVPFAGVSSASTRVYSVNHSIQAWVKADGCPEKPTVVDLPDKAEDGTTVTKSVYGPGDDGAEVVLYTIQGGGHTWPGRQPPVDFLGKATEDISANDEMWEFFQRHALK